jgi:hypothetical protein
MKKLLTLLSASILALGCASADSFESADADAGADAGPLELGQTGEELMASYMGTMAYGFKPVSENACIWGVSNQTCIVSSKKAIRYHIQGGTTAQRQDVEFLLNSWYQSMVAVGLDQSINGWLWSKATGPSDPNLSLIVAIASLSCFNGVRTSLTEAPGIAGSYERFVGIPVLDIDYDEIQTLALTTVQKSIVRQHAVYSGLLRFVGTGLVTVGDTRCNKADVITTTGCTLRPAHTCAANSFGDTGNLTNWWLAGPDCGQ